MKLYHGSNLAVTEPRLLQSDRKLDFGAGFYLTSSYEHAERWAFLTARRRGEGSQIITVYDLDEESLEKLDVLRFDSASEQWLKFVSKNRYLKDYTDDFDVVIGPVANDRTMPVIRLYFAGIYDEAETVKRLLPQKLKDQYAFKTEKALKILRCSEVKQL